jgi:hypothetical protein
MVSNSLDGKSSTKQKLVPREATEADIWHILHYAEKFHAMSPWRDAKFDPTTTAEFALQLIDDPNSVLFVHEKGMIGGTLIPVLFNKTLVLQEIFWYADADGRQLLTSLEDWGKSRGSVSCLLSSLHYDDEYVNKKYQKMYKKMNYTPQEVHYKKDLM